jgi:formamidopyrimidine-DNA glycosylase
VPELPEVESVRRLLDPVMSGYRFVDVAVSRPDLRVPFPRRFTTRLIGQTVLTLTRRAKYLLATLSSGDTLLMHLGMSGWFRIDVDSAVQEDRRARVPTDAGRHDHVAFRMSSNVIVTFNDPRRFGFMDLLSPKRLASHAVLSRLGLEPLSAEFDASALAKACKGKKTSLKVALLDQRVVAGLGNIYVSEALHRAGLSPFRHASTLATPAGSPRPIAGLLTAAIKQVLTEVIEREANANYGSARFRVYGREGQRCPTPACGGTVKRRTQAGRSTFYCPRCQR